MSYIKSCYNWSSGCVILLLHKCLLERNKNWFVLNFLLGNELPVYGKLVFIVYLGPGIKLNILMHYFIYSLKQQNEFGGILIFSENCDSENFRLRSTIYKYKSQASYLGCLTSRHIVYCTQQRIESTLLMKLSNMVAFCPFHTGLFTWKLSHCPTF